MNPSLLCIVDDDLAMRESLSALFRSAGHTVRVFSSAEAFLASDALDFAVCLVADVFLPGMTGPELQKRLAESHFRAPIVFLTGRIDETTRKQVEGGGAFALMAKPFDDDALLAAIDAAIASRR